MDSCGNSEPVSSRHDQQEMDVYSGVRWSAISKYGAQAVQFAVSIVLARLLAPEYFGLLGMATVVTGFVRTFRNLGFSAAIVQRKKLTDDLLSTLFWVNLAVCVLVGGVVVAVAPLAGLMYRDPRVVPIIAVLAINFVFAGLSMIPQAILQRQMAFKKLAVREIGAIIANGTTSIILALAGFGVWALVWGTLAGGLARVVLINLVCPFMPRLVWDKSGLKECLGFGLNITGFNIFNYFARNADNLIIGVFLGPVSLGYYSLAYRLMLLPRDSVSQIVTRVLFPKLSRLQDDDEKLADVYLRANAAIAFVTFPMMLGFAAVARPFVEVVLGAKWLPAVPVITILAILGALQSVWSPVGQLFIAKGRPDWYFRWGVCGGILFILSFFAGVPFGFVGVASAYTLVCLGWIPISWRIAFNLVDGLSISRFMMVLAPYALAAGLMAAGVFSTQIALKASGVAQTLVLGACITIGVAIYAAAILFRRPPAMADCVRFLPDAVRTRLVGAVARN